MGDLLCGTKLGVTTGPRLDVDIVVLGALIAVSVGVRYAAPPSHMTCGELLCIVYCWCDVGVTALSRFDDIAGSGVESVGFALVIVVATVMTVSKRCDGAESSRDGVGIADPQLVCDATDMGVDVAWRKWGGMLNEKIGVTGASLDITGVSSR